MAHLIAFAERDQQVDGLLYLGFFDAQAEMVEKELMSEVRSALVLLRRRPPQKTTIGLFRARGTRPSSCTCTHR